MIDRPFTVFRSMPFRLALGLVALFFMVSLLSFAATYVITQRALDQTMRDDLYQDMAGFRAAPSAMALAALVEAEARETDPERMVLTFVAPNGRSYGNSMVARDEEGYHLISLQEGNPRLNGDYLALTDNLRGGRLTIARNRQEIDALRDVFWSILALSMIPTFVVALSGGLFLANRSARQVSEIGRALDQLTTGDLDARVRPKHNWSIDMARIGEKIDEMARAQKTSVMAIKQVSSDIAHDLKTPLQRVSVYLDDLARASKPDAVTNDLLDKASAEVDSMASVFRSLLQIAQIESGSPRTGFRPVNLSDLIKTFVEIYEPTAGENGQTLHFDVADPVDPVRGDRNLLGQVIANLIENALRHAGNGAEIQISLTKELGKTVLVVADTGPGIPAEEREFVLRRLYRMDRSRTTPGNGLGLSVVKSIASLHDAELTLSDNQPGLCVALAFPSANARNSNA